MRVVPAVAPTFQLLVLPAGVPAPPKLVLAGSHCFLLAPVTAIYNVHRVDVVHRWRKGGLGRRLSDY